MSSILLNECFHSFVPLSYLSKGVIEVRLTNGDAKQWDFYHQTLAPATGVFQIEF